MKIESSLFMKYLYSSFFLFIVVLSLPYCKKDHTTEIKPDNPYGLPNATQTGADMFACRINGHNWISQTDIYHLGGVIQNDSLSVFGGGGDGFINILDLHVLNPSQGSTYILDNYQSNYGHAFISSATNSCVPFTANVQSINGAFIITKYDIANMIISGTFNCVIPIPQCDTLKITDGRFDIKFHH